LTSFGVDEHITGLQWCGKLMLINEGGVCGPGYPASFAATWHHHVCLSGFGMVEFM